MGAYEVSYSANSNSPLTLSLWKPYACREALLNFYLLHEAVAMPTRGRDLSLDPEL